MNPVHSDHVLHGPRNEASKAVYCLEYLCLSASVPLHLSYSSGWPSTQSASCSSIISQWMNTPVLSSSLAVSIGISMHTDTENTHKYADTRAYTPLGQDFESRRETSWRKNGNQIESELKAKWKSAISQSNFICIASFVWASAVQSALQMTESMKTVKKHIKDLLCIKITGAFEHHSVMSVRAGTFFPSQTMNLSSCNDNPPHTITKKWEKRKQLFG